MRIHPALPALMVLLLSAYPGAVALAVGPPGDYGDAPNGVDAYPPALVVGHFPTCWGSADGVVVHLGGPLTVYFGQSEEWEPDGNNGACWALPSDQDECIGPPDAGLLTPTAYRITATNVITTCNAVPGTALGPPCEVADWGGPSNPIDIMVNNGFTSTMYVNVLMDWNQDGRWNGVSACTSGPAPEHVLINFAIPPLFTGKLSTLFPPSFRIGTNVGYVWTRFTIGEVPMVANWDGAHTFDLGETEDYLLRVGTGLADVPGLDGPASSQLELEPVAPNPFRSQMQFAYTLDRSALVRITMVDAAGRVVAHLGGAWQPAGRHSVTWDGTSDEGRRLPPGSYFVHVRSGELARTLRVSRVN